MFESKYWVLTDNLILAVVYVYHHAILFFMTEYYFSPFTFLQWATRISNTIFYSYQIN